MPNMIRIAMCARHVKNERNQNIAIQAQTKTTLVLNLLIMFTSTLSHKKLLMLRSKKLTKTYSVFLQRSIITDVKSALLEAVHEKWNKK